MHNKVQKINAKQLNNNKTYHPYCVITVSTCILRSWCAPQLKPHVGNSVTGSNIQLTLFALQWICGMPVWEPLSFPSLERRFHCQRYWWKECLSPRPGPYLTTETCMFCQLTAHLPAEHALIPLYWTRNKLVKGVPEYKAWVEFLTTSVHFT